MKLSYSGEIMRRRVTSTPRVRAGWKRVDVAVKHLDAALREVQAARADLSRVVGAPSTRLARLAEETNVVLRELGLYAMDPRSRCELDHDPTPQELRSGHGPDHGCGREKRRT